MTLFHHTPVFAPVDPMADGLGDDITAERTEEGHFVLNEQLDGRLADEWDEILVDARKDPDFNFVTED